MSNEEQFNFDIANLKKDLAINPQGKATSSSGYLSGSKKSKSLLYKAPSQSLLFSKSSFDTSSPFNCLLLLLSI